MLVFGEVLNVLLIQTYQCFSPFFLELRMLFHIYFHSRVSAHLLLHRLLEFLCKLGFHLLIGLLFLLVALFGVVVEDISNFGEDCRRSRSVSAINLTLVSEYIA